MDYYILYLGALNPKSWNVSYANILKICLRIISPILTLIHSYHHHVITLPAAKFNVNVSLINSIVNSGIHFYCIPCFQTFPTSPFQQLSLPLSNNPISKPDKRKWRLNYWCLPSTSPTSSRSLLPGIIYPFLYLISCSGHAIQVKTSLAFKMLTLFIYWRSWINCFLRLVLWTVGKFKTKYLFFFFLFFFAYQKSLLFVFFLRLFFVFFFFLEVELTIIIRTLYQMEEPIQIESKIHAKVIITKI